MSRSLYLSGCDRDVAKATRAIETAKDDAGRAAALAERGSAWGEKARYSRCFGLVAGPEYERLFGLALTDLDRAVALDARSAEIRFRRGRTLYDRAALETTEAPRWFGLAGASFEAAVARDPSHVFAWDFLGLARQASHDWEGAIQAYTREMALQGLGRARLADLYCTRGSERHGQESYEAAIADYERSIELGAAADGCSCEPYNPLVGIYTGKTHEYAKAAQVVERARKARRWIAPELLEEVKKGSRP